MRKALGIVILIVLALSSVVPVAAAPFMQQGGTTYVVQAGDTLYSIAARFGVDVNVLAQANGISNPNSIYVGQRLTIPGKAAPAPAASGKVHVVQVGETLSSIAAKYGVTEAALAKANNITNANLIYVGQSLVIPGTAPRPASTSSAGKWRGEYYVGTDPRGGPVFVRDDREINFKWGLCSPDSRIPCDGFSVRWSQTVTFKSGVYQFKLTVDDGARLWIDGTAVLDVWKVQPETTYTLDVPISAGKHVVTLEYFEEKDAATAQLSFKRAGNLPAGVTPCCNTTCPTPAAGTATPAATDAEWQATYYGNMDLTEPALAAFSQPTIDFNWGTGEPVGGVPADFFGARWVRRVAFEKRTYAFCVKADDGIRVWIDDQRLIDEWHVSNGEVSLCRDFPMTAGVHTIKVEYFEEGGSALVKFWWEPK